MSSAQLEQKEARKGPSYGIGNQEVIEGDLKSGRSTWWRSATSVMKAPRTRIVLVFFGAALAIAAVVTALALLRGKPPRRPHIVFILADDLGWNDVSYNGCPQVRTPNIDALAWNGVRLTRYYTQAMCTPSRASLLTGRYAIHLGMQHDILYNEEPRGLPLQFKLLPQWLGDLGYATYMVGKWHLGFFKSEYTPTMRGFQHYVGNWGAYIDYFSHEKFYLGPDRSPGKDFRRDLFVSTNDSGRYLTQLLTEEATAIIDNHPQEKPLFLYLSHNAPHSANSEDPLQVPQKYIEPYKDIGERNRTLYAGMTSALDESVGAVFEALSRRGMLDNTVVVFSSDNGADTNSTNRNFASSWPFKGQKMTPWEGGVHCPALVWSPLIHGTRGSVYNKLFDISDWLPTLYQLAGGAPSVLGEIDGVSQLDTLVGRTTTPPRDEILVNIDSVEKWSAILEGDFKLVKGTASEGVYDVWFRIPGNVTWDSDKPRKECRDSAVARVLRKSGQSPKCGIDPSTYATPVQCGDRDPGKVCVPTKSPCLFDLSKDPCEYNNIAGEHPEILQRMLEKLERYEATALPPANLPSDPKSNPDLHNFTWVSWKDAMT